MKGYEPKLDRALRELKRRAIPVSRAIVGDQGFVFAVMGFMLTATQINNLLDLGKLNQDGIREFARIVENDPMARKRLPADVLSVS
jgi:hypothetical protein